MLQQIESKAKIWYQLNAFWLLSVLFVHSSFAIISMWKRELVALLFFFVFLVSRDCCVALHRDDMDLSTVCDCGIS